MLANTGEAMYYVRLFIVLLVLSIPAVAQVVPTPTPTPRPGTVQASRPPVAADSDNFDRLRALDLMVPKDRSQDHPLLDPKSGIYRKPGKAEIAALAVDEAFTSRYAVFLRTPHTGIVRLQADSSCISDTDIVVASERCAKFRMPGAGSSFSFRTESYRLPRLADLILYDGSFRTGGVLQQTVFMEAGDVPIAEVSLESKGMGFLIRFRPASDSDDFLAFESKALKGFENDGFFYSKTQNIKINSTYFMRSIAFRGTYRRSIDGVVYDELDYDKRRDVLVAFRVVDKDADGNITIVWKTLTNTEAPKLKIKK